MLRLTENTLTPDIYKNIRASVGMKEYEENDIIKALQGTLFSVVVWEDDEPVGIGRVIGDGRVAFFIKDVAVVPWKQGSGIGRMLMDGMMAFIKREGAPNAYVGLMALKEKEGFYQQFGFHVRPFGNEGSGMTQYLDNTDCKIKEHSC